MCHKNHIITDQKYKGIHIPVTIHQVSQVSMCLFLDKVVKDIQAQWSQRQLSAGLSLTLPTNTLSTVSQSNHPRRSQMAHEKLKNHCKICLRKVDTTKAGLSRSRYFSGLVIFKTRGLDYDNMGLSSSVSIKSGRFYLRTGL